MVGAESMVTGEGSGSTAVRPRSGPGPSLPIDAALVARAQAADDAAFEEIFLVSARPVTRYVWSILRDTELTQDVVAQTFLEAWRQLPRLRRTDRFEAWLFRIAHNLSMNELRRPSMQPIEFAAEAVSSSREGPEEAVELKEAASEVREGLAQLSEDQRQVIVLRVFVGLRHKEIALQMGRSEEAVRSLQLRGLRRLRELLGE
jgi:RNA polymerase sigma-70 factor (ECF subfamily)